MTENNSVQPHLKVVAGNPTSQELAIVIAVLQVSQASAAAAQASGPAKPAARWHRNPGILRSGVVPGHNQWKASFSSGLN
jgi:hypothetical protein